LTPTANRTEYCAVDWSFTGPRLVRETGIDKDSGPGDVAARVGHQVQDRVRGVVFDQSVLDGKWILQVCRDGGELLDKAPEGFVRDHWRVDTGRMHRVDLNPLRRKRIRLCTHQADDTVLEAM
jgi:hypothetical protein